jgi:hypothetical protein
LKRTTTRSTRGALAALAGLLFGPLLLVIGGRNLAGAVSARSWVPATATITTSQVTSGGVRHRSFEADVEYEYRFEGRAYEGDRIGYGLIMSPNSARELADRYRSGDTVPVFVDPARPSRSTLQRGGIAASTVEVVAGLLFVMMWLRAALRERRL